MDVQSSNAVSTSQESTASRESRNSKDVKEGWYFGKYLGRNKNNKNIDENCKSNPQSDELEGSKQDLEDLKQEAMIVRTVRGIRSKYLQRQLVGKIYIYRISGVIATAITSEVTAEDIMNNLLKKAESNTLMDDDLLMQAELDGKYKRALSTTDTILNSLERRSLNWDGCEFAHSTLLTRGTTVGVSEGLLHSPLPLSCQLQCTPCWPPGRGTRPRGNSLCAPCGSPWRTRMSWGQFPRSS